MSVRLDMFIFLFQKNIKYACVCACVWAHVCTRMRTHASVCEWWGMGDREVREVKGKYETMDMKARL